MAEKMYELDQVAIRMVKEKTLYSTESIDTPEKAVKLLADAIRDYDREVVCVINLNSALQPINLNICSMGAIDRSIVSPREVLKSSILSNASSVMFIHNHPSGKCEPSEQDVLITDRMQEVYKLMDIKLLDHIIIGDENYYSFTENKVMPDSKLNLTSIMELYQLKYGLEAQKEAIRVQTAERVDMNASTELTAHDIAAKLDEWSQDFDIYAYTDTVDDCAANVAELEAQIKAGQTESIKAYLDEAIEEGDEEDKIIIRAKELLKEIDEYKPLAKVEELEEQNYNMIDNRINNTESKDEKESKKKETSATKKFPGAKYSNFKIKKKIENVRFALIADVKMPDGKLMDDQIIGEFKDKASIIEYCKQNNIAYDDITNYLQNMIEHKKQKINEKKDETLNVGSQMLGKKGKSVGIDDDK